MTGPWATGAPSSTEVKRMSEKCKMILLRNIDPEDNRKLKVLAAQKGYSVNDILRAAIKRTVLKTKEG